MPVMAAELKWLILAILVGLAHLVWHSAAAQPQRGWAWNAGPRDEPRPLSGMAARLERAFANYRETFPLFLAAVVCVYLAGKAGGPLSLWGSALYAIGRLVYLPLYAFGVPYVRSLAWIGSMVGLVMVLAALA